MAAIAAATAVALVMTAGGAAPPETSTPLSPGTPHTVAQLLAKIADAAASQPAPVVKDSDFTYIRSMDAYTVDTIKNGHETSRMKPLHERQIWLPVANICVTGLLIEHGARIPISPFPVGKDGKVVKNSGLPLNFTCRARGTWATPATGCCSPYPPNPRPCWLTSGPARSSPTTTRPPRSAT
jgi:hypothetical protein